MKGGLSRRELLAGAAAGTAAVSGALAPVASAAAGDAATVAKTLAVELLAVFCYEHVLSLGILGAEAEQVAARILGHERAHVRALEAELRSLGVAPPTAPTSIEEADAELEARHSSGRLKGLPIATTGSPTCASLEFANGIG